MNPVTTNIFTGPRNISPSAFENDPQAEGYVPLNGSGLLGADCFNAKSIVQDSDDKDHHVDNAGQSSPVSCSEKYRV